MLNANEYLANIYGVLVKIDDKLGRSNTTKTTTKEKTATQGMGLNLGSLIKNPEAVKTVGDLGASLKVLSVGITKFWLVPKAAKDSIISFITSLSATTTKHKVNILQGMAEFSRGLQDLSSNLWKFWLLPKFVKNSVVNFFDFASDSKKMKQTTQNLKDVFGAISAFGKDEKTVKNISNMADSLTKAFKEIGHVARNMALLFLGIGGAILIVAGALYLSGKLLGVSGPAVLGVIGLTVLTIAGIFYVLAKAGKTVKEGAETGQTMGKALMYIAGGVLAFVVSWKLIAMILGTGTGMNGFGLAALVIVGAITAFAGIFWLLGKLGDNVKKGADTAKAMGVGLLFLAGGLLVFTGIAYLFSKMDSPVKAALSVALVVGALAGIFYLMGKYWKEMLIGTAVMIAFSIGVFVLSYVLKEVVNVAGMIEKLKTPGKTFLTLGLVVAALVGLFALVGQPEVAIFVALGAAVISAMVLPFLILSKTLINFADATKKFMDIAATYKIADVKPTVSGLISGVLGGFVEGFKKALGGGKSGIAAVLEATKNSVVIFAGIGLLMGVSVALSQFARALTAFADLGNMRVIEGTDKDGKPIFGEKIDVRGVGETMSSTIGSFLTSLIASTSTLTKEQGPAIRKMARALTGRRGMLSAVIGFAEAIKTYAAFGNSGNIIGVELVETNKKDADGNPIFEEKKTNISITAVVGNMVTSFSTFISSLADNVDSFAKLASGGPFSPVKRVARMLTGRRGILAGVIGFADALKMYSQFGADNMIPMLDADGQPMLDSNKKPIVIPMKKVAENIASSLSTFSEVLAGALDKDDKKNARKAKGTLSKFDDLIEQFNKLATAQEGLAKVSSTIGALAVNIGLLSTNLNAFDPAKFDALTNASIKANTSISKDAVIADKAGKINSSSSSTVNYNTTNVNNAAVAKAEKEKAAVKEQPIDYEKLAALIGAQVASAMGNKQWRFEFSHDKSGVMTIG